MSKITRKRKASSLISLPSMADIAFLLLIFFITASILDMEKEVPVRLPESRVSHTESRRSISIWLDTRGELFFNGERGTLQALQAFAAYRASAAPDLKALIHADRDLPFERVNVLLETLRDAGVYNIVLVSRKKGDAK